jgi:hypothetical protein
MLPQRVVTTLQVVGAALGIPAAAAGSYSAYQNYFSSEATCQRLRTNILATMERRIAADAKRALLRKDIAEFDKTCGDGDPDARTVFQAALQQMDLPRSAPRFAPTLAGQRRRRQCRCNTNSRSGYSVRLGTPTAAGWRSAAGRQSPG